jgi:hypothetical protein
MDEYYPQKVRDFTDEVIFDDELEPEDALDLVEREINSVSKEDL